MFFRRKKLDNRVLVTGNILIQPYYAGNELPAITTSAPNTGSYSWQIPEGYPGGNYKIGISAMSGNVSDFSDTDFTITNNLITVTYPNGGEVWEVGDTKRI
jgi:hypothetical protein